MADDLKPATERELAAIRERAKAAMPDAWDTWRRHFRLAVIGDGLCRELAPADHEFAANARADVDALLAAVADRIARLGATPEPLPPGQARAEADRLRAALREALDVIEAYPGEDAVTELSRVERIAREALGPTTASPTRQPPPP